MTFKTSLKDGDVDYLSCHITTYDPYAKLAV